MNESEALRMVSVFYLYGPDEWKLIWRKLPFNIRDIVISTFQLRPRFHAAKNYLLSSGLVVPRFLFAPYYDFIVHCVLAIRGGDTSGIQGILNSYVADGLSREALIHLAELEGIFSLT